MKRKQSMKCTYWLHCLDTRIEPFSESLSVGRQRIGVVARVPLRGGSEWPSVDGKLSSKVSEGATKQWLTLPLLYRKSSSTRSEGGAQGSYAALVQISRLGGQMNGLMARKSFLTWKLHTFAYIIQFDVLRSFEPKMSEIKGPTSKISEVKID